MSESSDNIIGNKNEIAQKHMGLVHSCCKHFAGKGVEYEELFSAGCLGLAKAVERFDESRGLKFSTYAVPVILGEIKHIFRDGGSVRVSRTLKELTLKICKLNNEYEKENGREMSITELSKALNVSEDKICEALSVSCSPLSLNADYDDNGNSRIDIPVSDKQEEITERLSLKKAIAELDERDRQIIHLRYFQNKTQSQTADRLAMTQVQVSRRERKILAIIREKMSV